MRDLSNVGFQSGQLNSLMSDGQEIAVFIG
jgi:hypothetical protein